MFGVRKMTRLWWPGKSADKTCRNADRMMIWGGAVSIGFAQALALASMTRPEDVLEAADQALYSAKRQGGCRAVGAVQGRAVAC